MEPRPFQEERTMRTFPSSTYIWMTKTIRLANTTPELHAEARKIEWNLDLGAITKKEARALHTAVEIRRDALDLKGR